MVLLKVTLHFLLELKQGPDTGLPAQPETLSSTRERFPSMSEARTGRANVMASRMELGMLSESEQFSTTCTASRSERI